MFRDGTCHRKGLFTHVDATSTTETRVLHDERFARTSAEQFQLRRCRNANRSRIGTRATSRRVPDPGRHVPRSGINVGLTNVTRTHERAGTHTRARDPRPESAKSLPEARQRADKIRGLKSTCSLRGLLGAFRGTCRREKRRQRSAPDDWAPVAAVLERTCGFSHPFLLLIEVSLETDVPVRGNTARRRAL